MAKSLKVSEEVHKTAKERATAVGMNLQSFVERAIQNFHPRVVTKQTDAPTRGRRRVAG